MGDYNVAFQVLKMGQEDAIRSSTQLLRQKAPLGSSYKTEVAPAVAEEDYHNHMWPQFHPMAANTFE
ncbi:Hypothetical predicted protein [Olea europaea subsp. europaea]|uniref:Uncharacterized protein n=1 Tax=Olea europaea subsp. europaea TaxID=158383 RepID=A0A8S0Q574_OLEEU|nr:Hypothetical predicted protein [Olea europaea subsp. europaea]